MLEVFQEGSEHFGKISEPLVLEAPSLAFLQLFAKNTTTFSFQNSSARQWPTLLTRDLMKIKSFPFTNSRPALRQVDSFMTVVLDWFETQILPVNRKVSIRYANV